MKIRMMAEIIDDNGKKITKTIEVEEEIPDAAEFNKENFYQVFDRYEKPALSARNRLAEEITTEYLNEASNIKKRKNRK